MSDAPAASKADFSTGLGTLEGPPFYRFQLSQDQSEHESTRAVLWAVDRSEWEAVPEAERAPYTQLAPQELIRFLICAPDPLLLLAIFPGEAIAPQADADLDLSTAEESGSAHPEAVNPSP